MWNTARNRHGYVEATDENKSYDPGECGGKGYRHADSHENDDGRDAQITQSDRIHDVSPSELMGRLPENRAFGSR